MNPEEQPQSPTEPIVIVDPREITAITTDNGEIHVVHEITMGDLLVTTLLFALIIMLLLGKVIRR